ncbi:MAG: pyridoxamine 5'-phosphate oxidase family protein [Clostridium sp.]
MNKEEMFKLMMENPAFHLATMEGDRPRVRGMLLFRADEEGIIFHTASTKEVFDQIMRNPKVELCFNSAINQVRVSGELELVDDKQLNEEIINHPSRAFLKSWESLGIIDLLRVFRLKKGVAVEWTFASNFDKKIEVNL